MDALTNISIWVVMPALVALIPIGISAGMGLNIWAGLAVAAYALCAVVTFQWGFNRFADRALPLRVMMGGMFGAGSWFSVAVIAVGSYLGWLPAVEMIREVPWGMPGVTESAAVKQMMEASVGVSKSKDGEEGEGEGEAVDTLATYLRMAVAAIPELGDRQEVMRLMEKGDWKEPVLQALRHLGLERERSLPPEIRAILKGSVIVTGPQG